MPAEPTPPGEVDPAPASESSAAASPSSKQSRALSDVLAAILGMIVAIVAAISTSRCDRQLAVAEAQGATESGVVDAREDVAGQRGVQVHGRLLRELPAEVDPADGDDQPDAIAVSPSPPSAEALEDPELAALLDELPAWRLEPPGDGPDGGCRVRAWQGGALIGSEVGCDADGRYAIELPPSLDGTVHLELLIPGQLRGLVELGLSPEQRGVLDQPTYALGPGHVVIGQTVDARGEPIAGVNVQALPRPGDDEVVPWRTVSDDQGRFAFTTLPYGPVSLRGIKPGYALSVVEAIAPEDAVLMVLDELIDLEGAVVATPDLLARAVVRLEGSSVWPAIEQALVEDGGFVFERLPDGIYGVEVTVPAEVPGGQEFASVPLENITPDLRINLALVPAFRVPVRVVDPEGEPVRGARVTLGYSQLGMLQKIAEADADGRASVGPVVPGPYFVHADADGFLPPEPVEVEVGPEGFEGKEQVLVLIRPAKLEGVVVDEDGRPVAGAEVRLDSDVAFSVGEGDSRRQLFAVAIGASEGSLGVTRGEVPDIPLFAGDEDGGAAGLVLTDDQGRFEIDMLLPGTHRIWATHGEHAASAVSTFELRSGELRTKLELKLREGVALTGVVRSPNGEPLEGVSIDLGDGLILTTDERGVFDAGFRRGRQELILRGPGLIPRVFDVDLRDLALDLELALEPAEGRFEGRAVDGNGQPIADVEVELRPRDGLSPSLITWTDARGLYEFDGLAPGPVDLDFNHPDYVAAADVSTIDEASGLSHEIVLDPGWRAEVLVRSAGRGEAISGVELIAGHGAGESTATTDKEGRAILTRLVGRVELRVEADGWVETEVELRDDGTGVLAVTVELAEGGAISGTIDDDIGEPVAGATIEIWSLKGNGKGELLGTARSDGRGQWRVDAVPEGDVVIHAEPPPASAAVLAPIDESSDVIRGEVTKAVRLRFDRR